MKSGDGNVIRYCLKAETATTVVLKDEIHGLFDNVTGRYAFVVFLPPSATTDNASCNADDDGGDPLPVERR